MHFGVCKLSEGWDPFGIVPKCKQDPQIDGYGVYLTVYTIEHLSPL